MTGTETLMAETTGNYNVRGIRDSISVYSLERGAGTRPRTAQPGYAADKFDRRGM